MKKLALGLLSLIFAACIAVAQPTGIATYASPSTFPDLDP